MFMAKSEYDRGVNTFSPEGRLFQVEYAIQAVKLGSTAVGIRTAEGVVLAVEKRLTSPLLNADSVEKIMEVDSHVGAAMSGLIADARTLVDHARVEAQNHRFTYDEPMQTRALTQAVCDLALSFGESVGLPETKKILMLLSGTGALVPKLSCRMKRPIGIGKVRTRQANQIGAPGRYDAINVIRLVDIADSDSWHSAIVANNVR